jgi:serine/threonine-protein kinase
MDAERWQRIEQIYHAAVVRDRERRASLLAEACSDDAELRREVELLLEANERAEGFMAVPAMELEARNLAADMPGTRLAVEPGQELSHYKILSRIGGGGMGEVFLAQDTLLDRKVAIKFLPSYLEADEMAKKRLLREAKAAASLDHPNICTIYEVGNHGEIPYIAMQRIEGESIHQALSRGPLSVERALKYALDIADALNEAHRRGIIHRDIKPSNIMVNDRDRAVVLDFGLAKQVAMEGPISEEAPTLMLLTSEMTIMGTIGYMSPEQVRREPLDSRSDIFSLGVLLYEMLTGVRPFAARDPLDVLHATVHQEPKPVSQVRPQTGTGLDAIIQRCLEKERERRYQSLLELKSDLIQIVEYREYKTELLPASDDLVGNTRPGAEQRTSPGPEPAT